MRIVVRLSLCALFAAPLCVGSVYAPQEQPSLLSARPDDRAVIRVQSGLVLVPVSVTDSAGQAVTNLSAQDFRIEEDGTPQPIAKMVEPGETPLELALLIDASGSVSPQFRFEQDAAAQFLEGLFRPADAVYVFAIGARPEVLQERTRDLPAALRALQLAQPTRSMTSFYDTVILAAKRLREHGRPESRRVQLVLSDGEDNYSDVTDVLRVHQELQRADCIFYSINPAGPSIRLNTISLKGQQMLKRLADQTGGTAFVPEGIDALAPLFRQIATELQTQYLLQYYSADHRNDGRFRKITVRIPALADARIRARQGYYAPAS